MRQSGSIRLSSTPLCLRPLWLVVLRRGRLCVQAGSRREACLRGPVHEVKKTMKEDEGISDRQAEGIQLARYQSPLTNTISVDTEAVAPWALGRKGCRLYQRRYWRTLWSWKTSLVRDLQARFNADDHRVDLECLIDAGVQCGNVQSATCTSLR